MASTHAPRHATCMWNTFATKHVSKYVVINTSQ